VSFFFFKLFVSFRAGALFSLQRRPPPFSFKWPAGFLMSFCTLQNYSSGTRLFWSPLLSPGHYPNNRPRAGASGGLSPSGGVRSPFRGYDSFCSTLAPGPPSPFCCPGCLQLFSGGKLLPWARTLFFVGPSFLSCLWPRPPSKLSPGRWPPGLQQHRSFQAPPNLLPLLTGRPEHPQGPLFPVTS